MPAFYESCAFGSSYAEGQKIFQLLKEQVGLALSMLQSIYFPGLRYIPTAGNRRFKKINDHIQTLLAAKADLLDILLDWHLKEIQQAAATNNKNQQRRIRLSEVTDDCKLFCLAGEESTSILLQLNQSRRISKDTKLGELSLPAGALVNLQAIYIHRDEDLWGEDAEEFKPGRIWVGKSKATRGNNAFFPFGWGRRICIVEKFALTEAKMAFP
ncbi:hypothetical protein Cgig2_006216 [Carnegiea gigantea]|uniref:Cytochrome P450 n=1 Tax=Carnegiea gigantea TaxID=171969 RepID=A0A9Q1KX13_9CARY|nr:hypothetical protein Cgig2_006216 [Carnegiea gigantea]